MMEQRIALNVLMLVENRYPEDVRVRNEAQRLRGAGCTVTVIALGDRSQARSEMVDGVRVIRVPRVTLFKKLGGPGSYLSAMTGLLQAWLGYLVEYVYFTAACLLVSLWVGLRRGVDVVHAHNPPDTLFAVGWIHKLFGRDFVFDHHDVAPELYLSRFELDRGHRDIVYRVLMLLEKLSLRLSTVSIATNESYKAIQVERGGMRPDDVFVVRNGPNLERVYSVESDPRLMGMDKCILGYLGVMNPQDGVDYLLRALRHLVYDLDRPEVYCVLIGSGDSVEALQSLADELGLTEYVWFTGYVSEEALRRYLSSMEICLDPNPSSPLNDVSTWIKIMEYMALEKPIVAFDLKETRFSARDAAVYVPANDEIAFAKAIAELMDDPERRRAMGTYGRKRVEQELSWDVVSAPLLDAYATLAASRR